jgi:hypothetical protein
MQPGAAGGPALATSPRWLEPLLSLIPTFLLAHENEKKQLERGRQRGGERERVGVLLNSSSYLQSSNLPLLIEFVS